MGQKGGRLEILFLRSSAHERAILPAALRLPSQLVRHGQPAEGALVALSHPERSQLGFNLRYLLPWRPRDVIRRALALEGDDRRPLAVVERHWFVYGVRCAAAVRYSRARMARVSALQGTAK